MKWKIKVGNEMRVETKDKRKKIKWNIKCEMEWELKWELKWEFSVLYTLASAGRYVWWTPGADVTLEYPRQQIICYLIHDIINSGV